MAGGLFIHPVVARQGGFLSVGKRGGEERVADSSARLRERSQISIDKRFGKVEDCFLHF